MHLYLENRRDIINPFEINSEMNFGVFYNAYYQRFVRYAFYYVNDLQAAEDLTHDALLYYWENKHKLPADADVLGYILAYIIHSGFISGYQNRYGDNLKPPTNVYHRMTA